MCYTDAATGLLTRPTGGARVPLVLGIPAVEDHNRSGVQQILKYTADLKSKTVRDFVVAAGGVDSWENIKRIKIKSFELALREGKEHPDAEAAHKVYLATMDVGLSSILADIILIDDLKQRRSVFWAIIEGMDYLETMRYDRRLPWDTAGGQLIPAAFTAFIARVSIVLDRALHSGAPAPERSNSGGADQSAGDGLHVFKQLQRCDILDSQCRYSGDWKRDRSLEFEKMLKKHGGRVGEHGDGDGRGQGHGGGSGGGGRKRRHGGGDHNDRE